MTGVKQHLFEQVWEKAKAVPGMDPYLFRKDEWGTIIRKLDFNNESSLYGWCIHYVIPPWEGGANEPVNLLPVNLHNEMNSLNDRILAWKDDSSLWD